MGNKIGCILYILFPLIFCLLSGCATTPGTLEIVSNPPNAPVYVDSQYRGMTPLILSDIPPGKHTLELRMNGFETWTTNGTMDDGEHVLVEVTLVPSLPATPAPLTPTSEP
jgi:hypothetical protein